MYLEIKCSGCGARYRVDANLAGRVVECKHCGKRIVVPGRSAVIKLDENDEQRPPTRQPAAAAPPDESFDPPDLDGLPDLKDDAPKAGTRYKPKLQLIPEVITDIILPLLIILAAIGTAGYTAFSHAAASPAPIFAYILIALAASLVVLVVTPLTIRGIESASHSLGFRLPNSVWLQAFALLLIPTAGMTLGYFNNGINGLCVEGGIGFGVMAVVMSLLYRINPLTAATTVLISGTIYLLGCAVVFGIGAALSALVSLSGASMPWQSEQSTVAQKPTAPPIVAQRPVLIASTPTTRSTIIENVVPRTLIVPPPQPPAPPTPTWNVCVDSMPATAKWPAEFHHILEIKPPVTIVHTKPAGPLVALIDQDACSIYDLRTGRRVGFIKEHIDPRVAALSCDGSELAVAQGSAYAAATSVEIISTSQQRTISRINPAPNMGAPQVLAFVGTDRLIVAGFGGAVQLCDIETASPIRTLNLYGAPAQLTVSAGGKYLASGGGQTVQIYDLSTGDSLNQINLDQMQVVKLVSFSPDGTELAIFSGDSAAQLRLIIIDLTSGKHVTDVPLAGGSRQNLDASSIMWTPSRCGIMVENDWIDTSTGRIVYTVPPMLAGTSPGRVCAMVSDYTGVVEYVPTGKTEKVIYKNFPLPKSPIDAIVRANSPASPSTLPATQPSEATAQATPATMPSLAADSESGGNSAAVEKLSQGLTELSAGHYRQAQGIFSDGIALYGKTGPQSLDDETQINLYHGLAIASLRGGDMSRARLTMDRLRSATKTNRSIQLNDAIIDVTTRMNLDRGIKTLEEFLASHPVEEQAVNLYGFAINKLESDPSTRSRAATLWMNYHRYESQLTPSTPGTCRWGSQWIGNDQYAAIQSQKSQLDATRSGLQSRIMTAQAELDSARSNAAARQSEYFAIRERDVNDYRLPSLSSAANQASMEAGNLNRQLDQLKSSLADLPTGPKPIFDPPPKGVDPTTDLMQK